MLLGCIVRDAAEAETASELPLDYLELKGDMLCVEPARLPELGGVETPAGGSGPRIRPAGPVHGHPRPGAVPGGRNSTILTRVMPGLLVTSSRRRPRRPGRCRSR